MPYEKHLKTTEERLARLSVLQELTVAALDLFDPESPADPFLERVAERLGCLAALWVAFEPWAPGLGASRMSLIGAAGLSEASRALPFGAEPADVADTDRDIDPADVLLPYPELARTDLRRWSLRLSERDGAAPPGRHALLLFFDPARQPPEDFLPAMERLVGVLVTVLSHRRLGQNLRHSYDELARTQRTLVERERLAAIGELAAVMAHEVRNPLGVIFNCIGSLQKAPAEPVDTPTLLGILSEEANRLNQIVSDLLDYARPGELLLLDESLEEVVTSAIAAVEGAAVKGVAALPVHIVLRAEASLAPLPLDARLLRRAMINLVTNAVQAMPSGGTIVVGITETTLRGRPAARVEVQDHGPGIPDAVITRIFEPFFTTKALGVGLGLAIVKHAVEAHRGVVEVRSRAGEGTTFTVKLPVSAITP